MEDHCPFLTISFLNDNLFAVLNLLYFGRNFMGGKETSTRNILPFCRYIMRNPRFCLQLVNLELLERKILVCVCAEKNKFSFLV